MNLYQQLLSPGTHLVSDGNGGFYVVPGYADDSMDPDVLRWSFYIAATLTVVTLLYCLWHGDTGHRLRRDYRRWRNELDAKRHHEAIMEHEATFVKGERVELMGGPEAVVVGSSGGGYREATLTVNRDRHGTVVGVFQNTHSVVKWDGGDTTVELNSKLRRSLVPNNGGVL